MSLIPTAQDIGKAIAEHLAPVVQQEIADAETRIRQMVHDILAGYRVVNVTTFEQKEPTIENPTLTSRS